MKYINECPICRTTFDWNEEDDVCPYCEWFCTLIDCTDMEDDKMGNPITYRQAKEFLSKGLNIWGNPLPKKK